MWLKQVSLKLFFKRVGLAAVGFLSVFYFLFTLMWGLNYHRRPIHDIVGIQPRTLAKPELITLCVKLIGLTNQSRQQVTQQEKQPLILPISHEQMLEEATRGFAVMSRQFPELTYTYPAVKQVYVPQLMSFFGIGGIYFPFTGEANVNMDPPNFLLPATVCHEMAHQIGVASEDEANFVSYLACRLNPNPAFQYSGNLMAMKYAMNRLRTVDSVAFKQLEKRFSPGLQQDLKKNQAYWEKFQNPIEVVSDGIHDLFLKANDQDEGLESYSMVVELLLAEFRKNQLKY
ncbi:membrane protein [Adhaeribacter aerolatus]|uniref:Membrane protein n=2 Tax=Adhaeribacter aerolatus TaxID=670289 RepID=A0A512B2G7_9BACT|nr:membrane protein [Adhaeribacter aerolatus]